MVIRKRFRNLVHVLALYAVAGLCVGYFLYHAQNGSRGLSSKHGLQTEIALQRQQLAELKAERKAWDERVELMSVLTLITLKHIICIYIKRLNGFKSPRITLAFKAAFG